MMKQILLVGLIALTIGVAFGTDDGNIDLPEGLQGYNMRAYERRVLRPGVTYFKTDFDKQSTGKNLFGQDGPCAIYWLVMEWDKCEGKVSLDIAYNENGQREMPTTWARERDAFAWVNGSYHKTTDPSAPIYELKVAGKEVLHNPYDQSLVWDRAGFGNVLRTANINLDNYQYAISGDGYTAYSTPDFSDTSKEAIDKRQLGRASRTFAGAIPDKRITIIGAADGRFSGGSIGLECNEERWLLGMWGVDLDHCVNLDGGGSTMCGLKEGDDYVLQSKPSNEKPERRVHHSIQIVDVMGKFRVEDTPHGSSSLTPGVITNVALGATLELDFKADDGYVIAAVMTNGVPVAGVTGAPRTYRLSLVSHDGLCEIGVAYAKANAWWIKPTVKNDFLVEAKSGSACPTVCLTEDESSVYFSRSTHSYNASSALTGIIGFDVGDLRNRTGGQTGEPILTTTNPNANPGKYVYDLAVSKAAGIAYATHKTSTLHGAIQPLDGTELYADAVSFPDDKGGYHTTRRVAFSTDGKYLWGGYNANAHIHEFAVYTDGTTGRKNVSHTGKVMKFKAANDAIAVRSVNGQDMIFAAEHGGSAPNGVTNLAWCVPGTMAVATNSSSIPVTESVKKKFDSIAVVGVTDGAPRIIGHINCTTDPNNGGFAVYELKSDYSGLRYPNPIVEFSSSEMFDKTTTGHFVSTEDESLAFIAYKANSDRELHALTVTGDESAKPRGEMYVEGVPATYGEPTPGYGRRVNLEPGETVACSAPATVAVGDQTAVCTGYQLFTNAVDNIGNWLEWKSGTDSAISFVMPEDVTVRLKWLWNLRAEAGFGTITTTGGTDASFTASAEVTGVGLGEGDALDIKVVWKAKAYCYTNDVATVTEPGTVSLKVDRMVMPGVTYYVRFLAIDKNGVVAVETADKKTPVPMGTEGNTFVMESEPVEVGSPYPAFGQLITGLPVGAMFEGYASYQQKGTPRAIFDHWTLYKKDAQGNWQQASTGDDDYHFTYVNDDGKDQKLVFTYNYWDVAGVKDAAVVGGTDASFTASACVSGVGMEKDDRLSVKLAWGLAADKLDHTNDVATATGYGPVSLKVTEDVIPGVTYYAKLFALDKTGAVALEEEVVEVAVPMGTDGNTLAIEGNPLAVGTALPAYGTLTGLPSAAKFDCVVTDRIEDATQRKVCTGWILYEKDAQGAWRQADQGSTCAYRYDNQGGVDRKLVWQWEIRAISGLANLVLAGDQNGSFDVTVDVTGVGLNDGDKLTVYAAWGLRPGLPSHTNEVGVATSVGTVSTTVSGDVYPGDTYYATIYAVDKDGKVAVALSEATVAVPDDGKNRTPAATATLLEKSDSGVDYNGYEMFYDLSEVNLGRYHAEDLRATYTVNGKTYDGEALIEGGVLAGIVFALDATGDNAILAGHAYAGNYRVWFESEERGATATLDEGVNRFVAGAESVENTDWFNETVAAFGTTGEWALKSGSESEVEPVGDYICVESTQDDPLVFAPSSSMASDTRALIETRFLYTEPSDRDALDVDDDSQCAIRVVRVDEDDSSSPCVPEVWAALSDGQGGWKVGWQQANVGDEYRFEVGYEYTVRFEIDYLGESWGAADTFSCFVRKEGETEFVKVFSGYPVNARHGGTATAELASKVEFIGTGKVAQLNGSYDVTTIDASVAEVDGTKYATVAAAVAVAAANGKSITLLHQASWQPTEVDLNKPVLFANRELLVLDMSVLGEAFVAGWTEKGELWELVLTSVSPWIDPDRMEGETERDRTEAAMKALGFDAQTAAAVAGAEGGYATLRTWAEARNLKPDALVGRGGVLLSAAIGADEVLKDDDVKVEEIVTNADGSVTLTVAFGDCENLLSGNQALIKAALGVIGAYDLGNGKFSVDNVDVVAKVVGNASVELKTTPKPVGDVPPERFFFRATVK